VIVNKETYKGRLAACRACTHFVKETQTCGPLGFGKKVMHNGEKVKVCGCVMPVKCKLRLAFCPIGRWRAEASQSEIMALEAAFERYKGKKRFTMAEVREIIMHYEKATGQKREVTACAPCVASMITDIGIALKQGRIEWK
tara:strand:- start:1201 stop:1623 length:423 start_codon:yes stop_codon:yes gene_type:complete